ncbi:MAG TPA: nucleotidyltransferase domain-containing protein [Planctomycetota bacterium]|nr:nucleotidyltransferase domain-containing protein [Planctomycetota bacterium]
MAQAEKQPWEIALEKFLVRYSHRKDVTAAVACGSFVTGNPSPRSDVDVHLVLDPHTKWRERGNHIINGIMIEYFANPPAQIRQYFKNDHAVQRQNDATMFVTGRILFDRRGDARRLKREAQRWLRRPFKTRPPWRRSLDRYAIFDHYDNFVDAAEQRAYDADLIYFNWVRLVYDLYARHLKQPVQTEKSTLRILTEPKAQQKYAARPFPDARFITLWSNAVRARSMHSKLSAARRLRDHVLRRMGGFDIDGWCMRTVLDPKCRLKR